MLQLPHLPNIYRNSFLFDKRICRQKATGQNNIILRNMLKNFPSTCHVWHGQLESMKTLHAVHNILMRSICSAVSIALRQV